MKHLVVCALAISFLFASNIFASNNISEIVFSENDGKAVIKVVGTQKPTFTVFKLREPLRLIVDISNASMKGIESPINIDNSVIKQIITSQFEDDVNKTSRLMLSLKKDAKYSVNSIGNSFYLSIENSSIKGSKKIVRKNKNIDYLSKREKELDRKRNTLSRKEEELSQREEDLSKKEEEILKLKTYIDGIKNKENQNNKVLTSLNKKNKQNQIKLTSLKKENQVLYSRIEELENLNKNSNDEKFKNKILALKKKKNNINSKLVKLNKEKKLILKEHKKLSRDKKQLLREKRNYNNKLASLKKENQRLRNNLNMLSSKSKNTNLKDIKVLQYKDKIVFRLSMKDYNGDFEIFELNEPKRIVLEIPNTTMNKSLNNRKSFNNAFLKSIRIAQKNKKVNFIVDISDKISMPRYFLKKDNDLLLLTVLTKNNKKLNNLLDINSSISSENLNLVLKFDSGVKYSLIREDDDLAVVKFYNVKTPQVLQNTLDLSKKNLNVKMASVFQSENNTILAVKLKKKTNNNILFDKKSNMFVWKFDNKRDKFEYTQAETASYSNNTPSIEISPKKKYKGKRISLDFKNADIHDVLGLIADVSKINIITSDEVSGTVTIRLRNVQWDRALDIILKTKGLGQEKLGNIIRVAPLEVLQKEFQDEIDRKNKLKDNDPLEVLLIPVSYARAEELVEQVKGILSKRGNVSVDVRTNVLVVKDIEEKLDGVKELVRNLDTQTPQVLIEGRIVEASSSFSRNQGVQWGGNLDADANKGSGFGVYFPSKAGLSGASSDGANGTWVTDLPATNSFGGLNFSVGSIADSIGLRLRLTAAESEGEVKFISSPRISTLDNKEATIETGMKIPITVLNAQGIPTSKLIDAKIKLTVVPHVTSDDSIILKVNMTKEEPDFSKTNRLGDPAILSKNASTELLVKNGNTAVIGGMFSKTVSHGEKRIPLLGKIPILGWFFKSTSQKDERSELLIFITPRIINKN